MMGSLASCSRVTVRLCGISGLCIVILVCTSTLLAKDRLRKKTDFGNGIQVTHGIDKFHSTCIWYQVFFVSGKFFEGLHQRQGADGAEFTNGHIAYRTFPDRLIVDLQATVFKCPAKRNQIPAAGFGEGLMSEPLFDLKWKDDRGNVQPVTFLSARQEHRTYSIVWDYFLELAAKDVPLTDALLIDVSLRGGVTHYRLAASLIDDPKPK